MSVDNFPQDKSIEQKSLVSTQENVLQKSEQQLLSNYKLSSLQDISNLSSTLSIITTIPKFKDQIDNIIIKLKSFPSTEKTNLNLLYTTLSTQLGDAELLEDFTANPLLYIDKVFGDILTNDQYIQAQANDKIKQLENENQILNKEEIAKINKNQTLNKEEIAKIDENQTLNKEEIAKKEMLANYILGNQEIINNTKQSYNIIKTNNLATAKLDKNFPRTLNVENFSIYSAEMKQELKFENIQSLLGIENKQDLVDFIRYQAYLKSKSERAKTDPTQTLTTQEADQVKSFSSFLSSAGIQEDTFFEGFESTDSGLDTNTRRGNRGKGKIFGELGNIASSTEKGSDKSDKKGLESVTNLSENIGSMKDKTEFDSIFRNSNDGKIRSGFETEEFIKSFPYPKDTGESDFKIDNPNLPQIIKNILVSNTNRPIIDTSTQDKSKIMRAKQSAILYHIIKNNPTISEDGKKSLAKILYPNQKKSWILGRSNDQIQGNIEKNLLGPLIMNTFCSEKKEQQINNETKKGYFTYINTFIKNTPGLQDFKIKSQRIEINNDGIKIPLYLEGDKRANAYLTLKDGKIYITNKFYNPGDVNSNNEITQGKVMVGHMDDIQTFRYKVTKEINPDIIKETLVTNNPPAIYEEHIQKIIDNNIRIASRDSESQSTSAGISHGLSQIKTQDSVIDTMKLRHSDGNTNIDNNKPIDSKSPFYLALRDYTIKNSEAAITKQNQPDTFDSLALIRTTMLRNSAGENEKMKENFITLQNLIKSESFNTKIESYLQQQASDQLSQQRHLILQTLTHTNRTKSDSFSLFLKLFGTSPQIGKEQINTIDDNRFGEFIQQLHGDLNNLSVNTLIPSTHPVLAILEKKYGKSADEKLSTDLNQIEDSDKIQTIVQ